MKWLIILIFSFISYQVAYAQTDSLQQSLRDSVINFAKDLIGTTYSYGGCSTNGFDCSGFVKYVYQTFEIELPRTSSSYHNIGKEIDLQSAKTGDIILFTGTNYKKRTIGHVGVIVKNENGTIDFIHSSSSKRHYGVTITRYNDSGYVRRFIKVIDVLG